MGTRSFVGGMVIGAGVAYLADPLEGGRRRAELGQRFRQGRSRADSAFGALGVGNVQRGRRQYGARAGDIDGLDAASLPPEGSYPADARGRFARRVAGAVLVLWGFTHRGYIARGARTVGAGLVLGRRRGGTDVGVRGWERGGAHDWQSRDAPGERDGWQVRGTARPGAGERRRVMDIQKSLYIDAPPDQVYAFWSDCENFPLFMSSIREVEDLGAGRSRWSVSGPGGVPIEWVATLTQVTPDEVIAWRSEPGAMLENAGVIRLRPEGTGTRVDLRICYNPPAGGAGRAVIALLGTDPREMLNEDLGRLKTLLEASGRSTSLEERGT